MRIETAIAGTRELCARQLSADVVVVGGGVAGVCAAITSARAGARVVLIQDRPVLGGNASSEIRLWILGATSHMGNNNRWAREGGVIDELLVENLRRNPEGNPMILDTVLLEWVVREPNITLLLNTAVHDLEKTDADTIRSVRAFCAQNSTEYVVAAPLFVDGSGDGIVGFLAGAAFRMGAEARADFGELYAPEQPSGELLGHTIYFYSKNTSRPVKFVPPSFALRDITRIPRWRDIRFGVDGCRLWWFEWGGRGDTIHDSEEIKWELWKVAYGAWDYIKNSGKFPEAETATLEWVGTIPGKRESRRFEGDYMLAQQDIVEQRGHEDAVSYGGWAIDLHPVDGVYSPLSGCQQWHPKGIYPIPYRCLYSRNITNLFLAGRIISASHIAFGSTRVMATCAHNAQAVGMAVALCSRHGWKPRDLLVPARMARLQQALLAMGQFIPGLKLAMPDDLARQARVTASSELALGALAPSGETMPLTSAWAMMLPIVAGPMPLVEYTVDACQLTTLRAELWISSRPANHTPDVLLATIDQPLLAGSEIKVPLRFRAAIPRDGYAFVCLRANPAVSVYLSDQRVTGVLAVSHNGNEAVTKSATQTPPPGSGLDSFEFWTPRRRPEGKNLAVRIEPPLAAFQAANLLNGVDRPTNSPNAWAADFSQEQPVVELNWDTPQTIARIELCFDTDFDHPMESVLMGHPERVMPSCVRDVAIALSSRVPALAGVRQSEAASAPKEEQVVFEITGNYQTRQVIQLPTPVTTDCLKLRLVAPDLNTPAALFAIRCFGPA
jgi:hypothetical protein